MKLFGLPEVILPTQTRATSVCLRTYLRAFSSLLSSLGIILLCAVSLHARCLRPQLDNGIRIDLPSNGQLRVENRFGDINVRVGKERDVLVAAEIEGTGRSAQSPVVIETKQSLLSISVVRPPTDPSGRINLTLRIPAHTRAEIIANDGRIVSHGLPASMSLNTIGGPILAELDMPLDVDIIARSIYGVVRSEFASATGDDHNYRSRFGEGRRQIGRAHV